MGIENREGGFDPSIAANISKKPDSSKIKKTLEPSEVKPSSDVRVYSNKEDLENLLHNIVYDPKTGEIVPVEETPEINKNLSNKNNKKKK